MPKQFRQGDVFLVEAKVDLRRATRKASADRIVLAYGEATGHHHSMSTDTVTGYLFEGRDVIVVDEPTPLTHQEHAPIVVAPGRYFVVIQREYHPSEIRRVID